jgi:hypothetical protein
MVYRIKTFYVNPAKTTRKYPNDKKLKFINYAERRYNNKRYYSLLEHSFKEFEKVKMDKELMSFENL